MATSSTTPLDVQAIRKDYPILHQTIHRDRPLIYFDNGASTQRPQAVIDAMNECYGKTYANVHRGIHYLSEQASAQYEEARKKVQRFINAEKDVEVIFTPGTTASINTVAHAWGNTNVGEGDEIVLTIFEHHSNIVPWQQLAARNGAKVKFVAIDDEGNLDGRQGAIHTYYSLEHRSGVSFRGVTFCFCRFSFANRFTPANMILV